MTELQKGQFAALERAAEPAEDILWPREGHTEVWTGKEFCIWGSRGGCFLDNSHKDSLKI